MHQQIKTLYGTTDDEVNQHLSNGEGWSLHHTDFTYTGKSTLTIALCVVLIRTIEDDSPTEETTHETSLTETPTPTDTEIGSQAYQTVQAIQRLRAAIQSGEFHPYPGHNTPLNQRPPEPPMPPEPPPSATILGLDDTPVIDLDTITWKQAIDLELTGADLDYIIDRDQRRIIAEAAAKRRSAPRERSNPFQRRQPAGALLTMPAAETSIQRTEYETEIIFT